MSFNATCTEGNYQENKITKGNLYLTNHRLFIIADKAIYERSNPNGFSIKLYKVYDEKFELPIMGAKS